MPLPVYRLRRLLAATALLLIVVVTGMYVYARYRTRDVRHQVPTKIAYDIKQTANGFQFSKSDGKRTLFSVQASKVKQFKLNGHAELHDVNIILYGRDSSRYDQISGEDFSYDPTTGIVAAKGEVTIDLIANPNGAASPDQAAPKELKNAIHLKTSGLVFNKETGDAFTDAPVEFSTPQASGSAVGVRYVAKSSLLDLHSRIHLELTQEQNAVIDAESGTISNDPRRIVLQRPQLHRQDETLSADGATLDLGTDNNLERVEASGNVTASIHPKRGTSQKANRTSVRSELTEIRSRADSAELSMYGKQSWIRSATLIGNVHVEQSGAQPMQADAGRLVLDFAGENELKTARATDGAVLSQTAAGDGATNQNYQISAPAITFFVSEGRFLDRAETAGAPKVLITSTPVDAGSRSPAQTTVVTAGKFTARFATDAGGSHLVSFHGAPDARILNSAPGEPDRLSTSDTLDASFSPQGGIQAITQQGRFLYTDNQPPDKRVQAQANKAVYSPSDQNVLLTGSPRVTGQSMDTTAKTIRINRHTGEAVAENDVKSTYSELKEQPNGALLASASPIHVTAATMTVRNDPGVALYTGNVRLWQDANVIEAPRVQFDRDRRFVTAQGTPVRPVQTILLQTQKTTSAKPGTQAPIAVTSRLLTYADSERKMHYEGGVAAKGSDFSASSETLDAYLFARGRDTSNQAVAGSGQLERMVAQGDVVIQQPSRRAEGKKLVYTSADDKFVLTGGPPSIFDAERGKITGVSLTFYRRDDRVLVEGEASTPVVTRTRVAP